MIPDGSRVLLDSVALIYFLEENNPYSALAETIFRRIESGELQGIVSNLVFAELLVPLYRAGDSRTAARLSNRLCNFRNLEVVPLSIEISMEAARLRAIHGLRSPGAIHGATGIITEASGILTNDKRLKILVKEGLAVWLFDSFVGE